ncbi:TetR/AcrR family transcriptional regulator [Gorillibacterium sp. sgz5001074]|uniref:TetR/AcrR family transcriptional regulator n=1 Tax=Gorillibacterium sp. sgz5001074 TaxID=3446695 RepID=UPI003F66A63E
MPRIVKQAEERRSELMDAAERLFVRDGYEHVPVSGILQEVGIAKGTFYHHFASKEELLHAVLERRLAELGKKAREMAGLKLDAVMKLRAVLSLLFPTGGDTGMALQPEDDKHALMHLKLTQMFYREVEPVLAAVTEQGVREGVFVTDSPEDVTQILLRGITSYTSIHYREMTDPMEARRKLAVIGKVLSRVLGMKEDQSIF